MVDLASARVGPFRYNSPWTQVTIVGFVAFCSVGMLSAISGMGAGGTMDTQLSDAANATLYGCFTIMGFFAGSINNILGPRLTLSIGTTGYSLYIGSLWAFQVHGTRWFVIFAGAVLGITAALLWAAQGSIMMAYPMEKDKGRSFSLFWGIFQLGTLTGAAIALGLQAHSTLAQVSTGVYIVFMIIQLTSIASSWLMLPPRVEMLDADHTVDLVVRSDGTIPLLEDAISPKKEFKALVNLFKDWRMFALLPMFFSSNCFYAYQQAIIAKLLNGRTRALASLLTGLGSIVGSVMIGMATDQLPFKRRTRALCSCAFVLLLNCLVWASGLGFQTQFTRDSTVVRGVSLPWDSWYTGVASGPLVLMVAYYIADAAFQGLAYYTMSTISNDPFKLARMAGYYKGAQSAGAAISFGMDAVKTPFIGEVLLSWLLLLVSLPLCAWVLMKTRETNYDVEGVVRVEDLKTDTASGGGVVVPKSHELGSQHVAEGQEVEKAGAQAIETPVREQDAADGQVVG